MIRRRENNGTGFDDGDKAQKQEHDHTVFNSET
jgi:hypothetical protein